MRLALLLFSCAAGIFAQDLSDLPRLKNYRAERISSYDRTGANLDGNHKNPIQPGETRTIDEVQGPGIITHMWVAFPSAELYAGRRPHTPNDQHGRTYSWKVVEQALACPIFL
jgi:hypothetical protein